MVATKIILLELKNIAEIEIVKNTSKSGKKITEQDKIFKMISEINKNTKNIGKESISDQPVNINDYIIVKFHHKNSEGNPSIAYLYNYKGGVSYIEQPYSGIWKLKEELFENISSELTK